MSDPSLYTNALWAYTLLCVLTVLPLTKIAAPYGRHGREGWGPVIPARVGWVLMESPAVIAFAAFFFYGAHAHSTVPLVLFGLWQLHYVRRTFIYPFRIRAQGKTMPALIAGIAFVYNVFNAYINASWIGHFGEYDLAWFTGIPFLAGIALFVAGMGVNIQADRTLRALRAPGETGYKIPHGGLYRWVSCPNYLGEILQWTGWAVLTWSWGGALFAVYTLANLAPRAKAHHNWYHQRFADYPKERRALFPFLW